MILSPKRLWENYDRTLLPLECSETSRVTTQEGEQRRVYFNGEASANGCTRIFARICTPSQKKDALAIVFPLPETDVEQFDVTPFLQEGWSVMVVDYAGNVCNHTRFTIYPSALAFANYNADTLYAASESPQQTCWYQWTTVALRSVTFAQNEGYTRVAMFGIGIGGAHVLKAAAVTDFPRCAVSLFSPGFFPQSDNDRLGINVSLNPDGYAPLLKIPYLQVCCSNDPDASLDTISELVQQTDSHLDLGNDKERKGPSRNALLYIAPRVDRTFTKEMYADIRNYLAMYLQADTVPDIDAVAPPLSFSISGSSKKLYLSLKCDTVLQNVTCYISHGVTNPAYRNWREVPVEKAGEHEFLGCTEVFSAQKPIYTFWSVTTREGFTYCTPVYEKVPETLHMIPTTIMKRRLIYESDMGLDDFFTMNDSAPLRIKEGPYGIAGICAARGLCTYKIGDMAYSGAPDSILQLILFSSSSQTITFSVTDEETFTAYTCTRTVTPDTDWTKIMLSASDFKSKDGFFAGWHRAVFLRIDSQDELIISSLLWV